MVPLTARWTSFYPEDVTERFSETSAASYETIRRHITSKLFPHSSPYMCCSLVSCLKNRSCCSPSRFYRNLRTTAILKHFSATCLGCDNTCPSARYISMEAADKSCRLADPQLFCSIRHSVCQHQGWTAQKVCVNNEQRKTTRSIKKK
jgi:hypothetical protein